MKVIKYPTKDQWTELLKRPALNTESLFDTVRSIIDKVRAEGDKAVLEYEATFDKVTLSSLAVTPEEIRVAETLVSDKLKAAISLAKQNIETFHSAQRFVGKKVETMNGVTCWQKAVGIEKVGLYIPGGTAPLFSTVLMLAVPAKIAGCKEIVLCTPPDKEGNIHPAILFAAQLAGVSKIFKAGGVQAIAAMAYGTESVPKVYKIFGPGNQYVTAAKQLVSLRDVAIDMPAGPSEVEVLADASANPAFVAARSIVCPTIPASTSSLTFAGQVITIYPVGFSPSDGPSQSFKYPANPNSLKTFSFSSSSHTILYLNGCLLAADGVSLAVSTSSISCCLVSFFS